MTSSTNSSNCLPDVDLVAGYRAGDSACSTALVAKYQKRLLRHIRSMLSTEDVSLGRDEDVAQETWLLLWKTESPFDPRRGSLWPFLKALTRTAARTVRAQYAAPGTRTRSSRTDRSDDRDEGGRSQIVSLEATVSRGDSDVTIGEQIADRQDHFSPSSQESLLDNGVIDEAITAQVMAVARPGVSGAAYNVLELMVFDGLRLGEAADLARIHRSTARREINSLKADPDVTQLLGWRRIFIGHSSGSSAS